MIMGGDNAPKAQVLGAMKAVEAFSDVEITLVGNKAEISPYLTEHDRINVIHTEEKILSTDEPVRIHLWSGRRLSGGSRLGFGYGGCSYR